MIFHGRSTTGEHSDVIVLAKIDRSLRNGFRARVADLEHTIEAEQLS
jgi:hypothetical protein